MPTDTPHQGKHIGMTSKIVIELFDVCAHRIGKHVALMAQINFDIGSLETVDTLLGIANRAQVVLGSTGNKFDEVYL